ncbi:MAG: S8 family serine peptidase [Anaerolineae bacterium]
MRYNMDKINAPEAWPCVSGGQDIIIAILDTGADSDHPDLLANFITGTTYYGATWEDGHGHGTHTSGIAAGVANNGGIMGVAPRAKIMPVKVLSDAGSGSSTYIANGIIWAVNHGAKVINMSLGSVVNNSTIRAAVVYAYTSSVAIIVSAGNCGGTNYAANGCLYRNQWSYPAAYTEVIAVASTDSNDQRSSFSTSASYVDVAAPGSSIVSSYYTGTLYASMSGTSMAAPHVAGEAALIRKLHPEWTVPEVYARIISAVVDISPAGFDNDTGWGRIDAQLAVTTAGLAPLYLSFSLVDEVDLASQMHPDWTTVEVYDYLASLVDDIGDPGYDIYSGEGPTNASKTLAAIATARQAEANALEASMANPSEFRAGVVLFKMRPGAKVASVLNQAAISSSGLQADLAVPVLGVLQLHVPQGEETYWLKQLRALPGVEYAELDGIVYAQ